VNKGITEEERFRRAGGKDARRPGNEKAGATPPKNAAPIIAMGPVRVNARVFSLPEEVREEEG
jgi:hypothetical protein